jgi:glycosyltransferase involved in cell wall biosynthesis
MPQAVMFHDFLSNRERRPFLARKWDRELYFRYKNWKAAKVADRIFTNSSHTRAESLRLYPFLDPGAVSAIHLGARFRADAGQAREAADAAPFRFPSRSPFPLPFPLPLRFLYVGSFETRKNIPALLENLDRVAGGRPFRFDLVGRIPDAERARLQALGSVHAHGDIRFHGRIGDQELGRLYADAHFLLFPSLGEGFGLPIVEAMSFGLVVLAFANTCIPEVAEDAAILAADGDFPAWGAALTELVSDPARYAALSGKARARASHFTEEKMFQRYAAFFRDWFRANGLPLEPGAAP